jgi:diguanylate cyclase (GGDEF)-like protein
MSRRIQTRWLLGVAVVAIAAAVWFGGKAQRSAGDTGEREVRNAQAMLTARLDLETGLRGFLLTGRERFLQPYFEGLVDYRTAARRLATEIGGGGERGLLESENRLTRSWLRQARAAIAEHRAGQPPSVAGLRQRKAEMDRFRAESAELARLTEAHRRDLQDRASRILLAIIAGLVLLSSLAGYLLIERPGRRLKRQRIEQEEFAETLQFADGEREAQELLIRQLNRTFPGGSALVFSRNNSENRLVSATELDESSPLRERIATAVPSDCLAVRRGRRVERREDDSSLLECDLCGKLGPNSVCLPSLVGGEVIGSVLVSRESKPFSVAERRRLETTVTAAAPVLANLRNLAIAETRAVTDSLTGLSNARAAAQDLERIVAFAGRTATPLAAILLDLDHFKRINDTFGHQIGDEALAAVGAVLRNGTRKSDFVARYGGEEFLILLQDTDARSGIELAEKLREGVRHTHVPGLTGRLTASFGVAAMPEHAGDGESLIRAADRALYTAKENGRDRVCVAGDTRLAGGPAEAAAPAEREAVLGE